MRLQRIQSLKLGKPFGTAKRFVVKRAKVILKLHSSTLKITESLRG